VIGPCVDVTDLGAALSTLTRLAVLDLQHFAGLPDAGMRVLADLTKLTQITFCGCFLVTDEGVRAVARLPALSSLLLESGHVTDKGLRMLSSCVTLTQLSLCGCTVTNEGLRALRTLKSLAELILFGCSNVTAEGHTPRPRDCLRAHAGTLQLRVGRPLITCSTTSCLAISFIIRP
jgi:hypothetical protein